MYCHIYRGTNRRFHAMVRQAGYRKWESAGPRRKAYKRAVMDLARAMATDKFKRGIVLFSSDYYDSTCCMEMKRL